MCVQQVHSDNLMDVVFRCATIELVIYVTSHTIWKLKSARRLVQRTLFDARHQTLPQNVVCGSFQESGSLFIRYNKSLVPR